MTRISAPIPRRSLRWASGLLLLVAGCAEPSVTASTPVTAPPVAAGQARVWFYRAWEPSESLNLSLVDMNDSYVGAVANGGVFYRDVPPGNYRIAPHTFGRDFNQDRNVDLASGQQLYVKILSLSSWGDSTSTAKNIARDAFYAWVVPPEKAQAEIARDRSGI